MSTYWNMILAILTVLLAATQGQDCQTNCYVSSSCDESCFEALPCLPTCTAETISTCLNDCGSFTPTQMNQIIGFGLCLQQNCQESNETEATSSPCPTEGTCGAILQGCTGSCDSFIACNAFTSAGLSAETCGTLSNDDLALVQEFGECIAFCQDERPLCEFVCGAQIELCAVQGVCGLALQCFEGCVQEGKGQEFCFSNCTTDLNDEESFGLYQASLNCVNTCYDALEAVTEPPSPSTEPTVEPTTDIPITTIEESQVPFLCFAENCLSSLVCDKCPEMMQCLVAETLQGNAACAAMDMSCLNDCAAAVDADTTTFITAFFGVSECTNACTGGDLANLLNLNDIDCEGVNSLPLEYGRIALCTSEPVRCAGTNQACVVDGNMCACPAPGPSTMIMSSTSISTSTSSSISTSSSTDKITTSISPSTSMSTSTSSSVNTEIDVTSIAPFTDKEESTEAPEEDEESTEAPEEDNESTAAPEEDNESTAAPEEDNESTEAPEEDNESTEAPEEDNESTEAPEEDNESTEAPEEDNESTEAPEEDNESTEAPEEDNESTEAPEEDTESPTGQPTNEPTNEPTSEPTVTTSTTTTTTTTTTTSTTTPEPQFFVYGSFTFTGITADEVNNLISFIERVLSKLFGTPITITQVNGQVVGNARRNDQVDVEYRAGAQNQIQAETLANAFESDSNKNTIPQELSSEYVAENPQATDPFANVQVEPQGSRVEDQNDSDDTAAIVVSAVIAALFIIGVLIYMIYDSRKTGSQDISSTPKEGLNDGSTALRTQKNPIYASPKEVEETTISRV